MDKLKPRQIFFLIFFLETLSFFGYFYSPARVAVFFALAIIALILTVKDLRFGILAVFLELIIGSKGYLFYFEAGGISLSIRIVFWLIVMSVWITKTVVGFLRGRREKPVVLRAPIGKYFIALGIFVSIAVLNGFWRGNDFGSLFFDFNNWLFFLLAFPFFDAIKNREDWEIFWKFSEAAVLWLAFKTFFALFFFSHATFATEPFYRWLRTSGVGEVTLVQGGFFRVFFQSHIFSLAAFFVFFHAAWKKYFAPERRWQKVVILFLLAALNFSIAFLSFSRSFWVGAVFGSIIFACFFLRTYGIKKISVLFSGFTAVAVVSALLILVVVKFPYPNPLGGFEAGGLFADRATDLTSGAAVSSRWSLLPELWSGIKTAPVLGRGFGAEVTYKTSDPKVLESSPDGLYTTYAFEWGWLDFWLKLGLLGILACFMLIIVIFFGLIKNKYFAGASILAALAAVHFFTPYFNHPLGIGIVLILAALTLLPADA